MGDSTGDTTDRDESTERTDAAPSARRRNVLRALGGAGALGAFAGTGAARGLASAADSAATDASTPAEARERARQDGEIDPVWGFPALSDDAEPPTSPQHEVELQIRPRDAPIPEFVFEPTGLYVEPGDTVRFSYESPHHTVTAYHPAFGYVQRVPDDVPPFSAPALPQGGYWLYTFDQSGVYELHCAPHEIFGHAMRVVVGSPSGPAADPLPDLCAGRGTATEMGEQTATETATAEAATTMPAGGEAGGGEGGQEGGPPEPEPPRLGAYAVLTDPALDPEAIVEERRVSWDDLAPESKQLFVQIRGFPPC
ncbi:MULTISPECIES: plastocyanin [Halorussus]|uniref:cupredoxin domain-containing protein n=1 Tax=Halorussus TaxID=1070314 RepID=UPI0013B398C9|nr:MULTISPECIES: plastocyanin [Halorussus]NHN60509.1 plastocyanin [Halorussus sp. JP-T4]